MKCEYDWKKYIRIEGHLWLRNPVDDDRNTRSGFGRAMAILSSGVGIKVFGKYMRPSPPAEECSVPEGYIFWGQGMPPPDVALNRIVYSKSRCRWSSVVFDDVGLGREKTTTLSYYAVESKHFENVDEWDKWRNLVENNPDCNHEFELYRLWFQALDDWIKSRNRRLVRKTETPWTEDQWRQAAISGEHTVEWEGGSITPIDYSPDTDDQCFIKTLYHKGKPAPHVNIVETVIAEWDPATKKVIMHEEAGS